MKNSLFVIAFILTVSNVFGQVIVLKQKKAKEDIKVMSNGYELFFKKTDILSAINTIDQTLKTNHTGVTGDVQGDKITVAELTAPAAEAVDFVRFFKTDLGSYLLLHGKGVIYKGGKQIAKIMWEKGPLMENLNGSQHAPIRFAELNVDEPVFIGEPNTKLL